MKLGNSACEYWDMLEDVEDNNSIGKIVKRLNVSYVALQDKIRICTSTAPRKKNNSLVRKVAFVSEASHNSERGEPQRNTYLLDSSFARSASLTSSLAHLAS